MTEPRLLSHSLFVALKSVRLETLDEHGSVLTRASGFLLKETDGLFLYTCWHVVTGVDFLQPDLLKPPIRRSALKIYCQAVEARQPGIQSIGGTYSVTLPLYDSSGQSRWIQEPNERTHADLAAIGIKIPKFFDVVRISLELDPLVQNVVEFLKEDILTNFPDAGTDIVIVGYPYGYSAMDIATPEPVFIKRSIASSRTSNSGSTLLDGAAAPGMSGAPIVVRLEERWWLLGMYTGVIFPDYQHKIQDSEIDRRAALGVMAPIYIARAFMQVPNVFEITSK